MSGPWNDWYERTGKNQMPCGHFADVIHPVTGSQEPGCSPTYCLYRPPAPPAKRTAAFNRILDILAGLEPDERAPVLEAARVALDNLSTAKGQK